MACKIVPKPLVNIIICQWDDMLDQSDEVLK